MFYAEIIALHIGISSQARKLEVVKKTQYVKGKIPKFKAFLVLPSSYHLHYTILIEQDFESSILTHSGPSLLAQNIENYLALSRSTYG